MTLLQDFRCLGNGRQRSRVDQANPLLTALYTASPQHEILAKGEKQDLRDGALCVEEDSGYQTSENDKEGENEDLSDTLDLPYQRKRLTDQSYTGKDADILDLSYVKDGVRESVKERGLTRDNAKNGTEQALDAAYNTKGHFRLNLEHEKSKRRLPGYLESDECEGTSNSEHEKRKRRRTVSSTSDDNESILSTGDEEGEKVNIQTEAALENPLAATSFHSGLRCCTNGFFRATGRTFSNFETNCECTTHTLVDWRTRVTWTNANLHHQVKIREVTILSPFRNSAILRGLPYFMRVCPPSQPRLPPQQTPQPPEVPETTTRIPQQPIKVKKEQDEDSKHVEGERGYRCIQVGCGRTFCRNEELTRHLRIHSGQRPFVCQRCGRRFVRRDHLTKHQRTHLPAHVKRSYTCPLPACTHRYTRSDALTRHMWTAHHIRARQPSRAGVTDQPRPHHHQQPRRPKLET